ncbi:MAG: peptidase [Methylotenera sp.]|uniref:hypothetical protein n=1 Tax=Methylotenera sp. TaxID=2051956 RepID=UPI00182CC015|nr:hypothetical protein [Methylotenera sp.]NOU24061.1 peptidase [Methylotenera sp.]
MNHDFLIKTTNKIALWSVIALFYWIFIFICITVFDLKIFREHITETFLMSILGIFALLGGALVLNVMSNLSKISASVSSKEEQVVRFSGKKWWLLSLPIIFSLLFCGNLLSAHNKEKMLVNSALSLIKQNPEYNNNFADYRFDDAYIQNTAHALQVVQKIDKFFPEVLVIQKDLIDNKTVFLRFDSYPRNADKKQALPLKQDYIFTTGKTERAYLEQVFDGKTSRHLFIANQGNYELFYPVNVNNKHYVMYFSDFQRYGKLGS